MSGIHLEGKKEGSHTLRHSLASRLGVFKAVAALQHTTLEQALAGMLAKHIVSLFSMQLTGAFCQRDKCLEGKMGCKRKLEASLEPLEILAADYPALFKGGGT